MGNDNSTSNRISRRDLVKGTAAGAGAAALLGPLDIARAAGWPASSGVTVTLATNASFQTYKGLHGGPLYTELAAELKRQTGIILNVVFIPENLLYNKVQLDIVGGARRYDMMETGAGGAKQFGMAGRLLALPRPKDIGDFFPGDIQQYSLGSKLYGYPKITDTNLYYWRTDLVKKAGFDATRPPATLAEARARAIALTVDANGRHPNDPKFDRGRVVVYGDNYKGTAGLANTWEWYNYLFEYGGEILSDKNYALTLDQPAAVDSLQWVVDNFRTYKIYPDGVPTFDYTEFASLFYQGKVATCLNWPYMYTAAQDPKQSKVAGKVAVGLRPGKVTHGGELGGWSINVLKQTSHPDEAVAIAAFLSSPDAMRVYSSAANGLTPARKSLFDDLTKRDPALYSAVSANLAHGKGLNLLATGPSWMACENVLQQAIQSALIGKATPKAALSQATSSISAILRQNRFYEQIRQIS